ncbi:MAG: glutamate synthase subunit beta [Clostridiales bacterium]|nr:glutamate synthase subunit beta [Clostridiales bacterium]
MGKLTGFLEYDRRTAEELPCDARVQNWDAFHPAQSEDEICEQAARCMNCGVPFCHAGVTWRGVGSGCSLGNLIPEWNHLVFKGHFEEAFRRLEQTNPLHECTSRVCPALCEGACTNGLNGEPVAIREIERFLSDMAWEKGWVIPRPPKAYRDKSVAVIGSGPSGLTAAHILNQRGFHVTVFEKSEEPGGLLMFGIPNMKLPKELVRRRVDIFRQEGIEFVCGKDVGKDLPVSELDRFDAVLLCGGAGQPRDLTVSGRNLPGVRLAVPFLAEATRRVLAGDTEEKPLLGHKVVVIGGGDTGNDCVATSIRMGANAVVQLEIMPPAPEMRAAGNPWPRWPLVLKTDYGQQEAIWLFGNDPRTFETTAVSILGDETSGVTGIETAEVEWVTTERGRIPKPIESTRSRQEATDVLIAMGFVGAETYLPEALQLTLDRSAYATSRKGVFTAGDMRTGQSLVVRASADAKRAAEEVERYLGE